MFLIPFPPSQEQVDSGIARVFWLPFRPTLRAFPEASSSGVVADFVHGYSCGAAVESHHLSRGSSSFSDVRYYLTYDYQKHNLHVKRFLSRRHRPMALNLWDPGLCGGLAILNLLAP